MLLEMRKVGFFPGLTLAVIVRRRRRRRIWMQ
jgi:hypothetical protein